jgi:hypothetical protein
MGGIQIRKAGEPETLIAFLVSCLPHSVPIRFVAKTSRGRGRPAGPAGNSPGLKAGAAFGRTAGAPAEHWATHR